MYKGIRVVSGYQGIVVEHWHGRVKWIDSLMISQYPLLLSCQSDQRWISNENAFGVFMVYARLQSGRSLLVWKMHSRFSPGEHVTQQSHMCFIHLAAVQPRHPSCVGDE